jgi:hypothetical protein
MDRPTNHDRGLWRKTTETPSQITEEERRKVRKMSMAKVTENVHKPYM